MIIRTKSKKLAEKIAKTSRLGEAETKKSKEPRVEEEDEETDDRVPTRRFRIQSAMDGTVAIEGIKGLYQRHLPKLPRGLPLFNDIKGAMKASSFGVVFKRSKVKESKKEPEVKEPKKKSIKPRLDGTFSLPVSVLGEGIAKRIEDALSIQPKDMSSIYGGKPPPPYKTTVRKKDEKGVERLHISRALGEVLWGPPSKKDIDRLGKGTVPKENFFFKGSLIDTAPPQRQAVDRVKAYFGERTSKGTGLAMLVAPTGTGKTVMGLGTASELTPPEDPEKRYITAVVCHRDILLTQWKERIGEFLPNARVGMVQGNEFDVIDKDIVIFMIDSLLSRGESPEDERAGVATDPEAFMAAYEAHMSNPRRKRKGKVPKATLPPGYKKYPAFLLRRFGLVIYDEGHHLASKTYAKAFGLLPARCCLTLTATPKRGGKIIPQLFWICGEVVAQFPRGWQAVNVRGIRYENPATQKIIFKGDLVAVWEMNKALAYDFDRNDRIVEEVGKALKANRHVLVFTERVKHSVFLVRRLQSLKGKVGKDPKREKLVGWYTPSFSRERRHEELKARVIVTTFQYAREGLDVKTLDTVILGSPVSQLEQILGRIFRPCPDKQTPLVIDIFEETIDLYKGMWGKRYAYYTAKEQKYNVELMDHKVSDISQVRSKEDLELLEDLPSDEEEEVLWEDVVFHKEE